MVLLTLLELDGVGLGMGCRLGECKNTIHGKNYYLRNTMLMLQVMPHI